MIQASKTTITEPTATTGAKAGTNGENLLSELGNALEGQDFSNELAASLAEEIEVQPVNITEDQLLQQPSALINNLPQSNPDAVSPKVFDPAITQGVEQLNQPSAKLNSAPIELTNEQVLELANVNPKADAKSEVSQAMLKTPQLNQVNRSPAIDMNKTEIDPQLMDMEDFVLQKNMLNKKAIPPNGYGMKSEAHIPALENGLKSTEVVTEVAPADGSASKAVNSQQFILDMLKEQGEPKISDVQHVHKTFNMSDVKSDNPNQIMTQITDYIMQAKAAKEPTVSMRVNHDELGMLDITVRKGQGINQDSVAINIGAHSSDGKNFFQQNSKNLFSHLGQSGINVSDLKIETPSQTAKNDFDMNHHGKQGQNNEKNFGSEQNQRRHDQNRRQDLWDILNDKEAA